MAESRWAVDSLLQCTVGTLGAAIVALRVRPDGETPLDEQVFQAIRQGKIYRDEFIELLEGLCAFGAPDESEKLLGPFFEQLLSGCFQQGAGTWGDVEFDPVRFSLVELFLYAVAVLLAHERLPLLSAILDETYVFSRRGNTTKGDFTEFYSGIDSLDRDRNQRLNLNRTSVVADLLKDRADHQTYGFEAVQQADFLLFVRARVLGKGWWQPRSLVYLDHSPGPFEIFVAPESRRRFAKLQAILGVRDVGDLKAKLEAAFAKPEDASLRFGHSGWPISIQALVNLTQ